MPAERGSEDEYWEYMTEKFGEMTDREKEISEFSFKTGFISANGNDGGWEPRALGMTRPTESLPGGE